MTIPLVVDDKVKAEGDVVGGAGGGTVAEIGVDAVARGGRVALKLPKLVDVEVLHFAGADRSGNGAEHRVWRNALRQSRRGKV